MFRSPAFFPTNIALLRRRTGYTPAGRPQFGSPITIGISPIRIETSLRDTSIRTDKSGSKSRAEEDTFRGRILIEPTVTFAVGDLVEFAGQKMRIVSKFP